MNNARNGRPVRQYVAWTAQAAAAIFGAVWGWGFGAEVGGTLLALVAALNCAAFAALLTGSAMHWLLKPRGGGSGG